MIEPMMYFGIGFLAAALLGLLIIPLVHSRAVRLTTRRLEAATPLSMAEIQADKDQLRAEFAMSTRRLEMSVEQMKTKTASQLAELGKKTDAINRLKVELGEKTTALFAAEAREKTPRDQAFLIAAAATARPADVERQFASKQQELAKESIKDSAKAAVHASALSDGGHRLEIAALQTQVEALKSQLAHHQQAAKENEARLAKTRRQAPEPDERAAELERDLAAQKTEVETIRRRLSGMETRLQEQARVLAEREFEAGQLRTQLDAGRKTESDLRADLAASANRHRAATENLRKEKARMDEQLRHARGEQEKLQSELATLKRGNESTWAQERVENALLRERINDVAAEVARLTSALEGEGSPIEKILAEAEAPSVAGTNGDNATPATKEAKGNLAERIRALQNRASRIPQ